MATDTHPPLPAPPPAPPGTFWRQFRPHLWKALTALALVAAGILVDRGLLPKEVKTVIEQIPVPQPLTDLAPIDYEGARYDGGTEHDDHHHVHPLAAPEPARWPTDRITYGLDYASARGLNPPLPEDAIRAAFRQAANWWGEQLQIEWVEVAYTAGPMVPVRFERIDGPQGVLAEAYLADGTTRPKPMRFDSSERWTPGAPASGLVSLPTVACHELGHTLGLGHDAANAPAVMRPSYTASIPREQERDILRMVSLGYLRRPRVPPAATDVLSFPVQVKTDDVIQSLRNAGYTVTK